MADVAFNAFAGLRNTLPVERLKPEDLAEAVNVTLDDSGRVARRDGQTLRVAGSGMHSLWSDGEKCCYVQGGGMYTLDTSLTPTLVALGLTDAVMAYASVAGRVYHSNGKATGVLEDGRVRAWGIPLDGLALGASATSGVLPAGTYQFAMTWLTVDGQESGTGLAGRIDLEEGSGIVFSWAVPDDLRITQAAIYLTLANGEVLLHALTVDVEAASVTYIGGGRSLPLATQWLDAPPAGQCLAHFRGRIYIAAGVYLYATAAHGLEYCDLRDYLAFDGTRINVLLAVEGGLFVGTERALYFLSGPALAEHSLTTKLLTRSVPGSGVLADGLDVTGRAELAGVPVALLTTTDGILLGLPDGSLSNLSQERYQFAVGQRAAVIVQKSTSRTEYLLSMQDV